MSLPGYAPPLRIEVQPSRRLQRLVWLFHVATAGLVIGLPLNFFWQVALLSILLASLYRQHQRLRRGGELSLHTDGRWLWQEDGGEAAPIQILADTYVAQWLVVISCRAVDSGRRLYLPLMPDSLPPDQMRQLRVALQLRGLEGNQEAAR